MEDGFTSLEHNLLEACYKWKGSLGELQVLLFFIRKLNGYHKDSDAISYSQITSETGISRRAVADILENLVACSVVIADKSTYVVTYTIEKDTTKWNFEMRIVNKMKKEDVKRFETSEAHHTSEAGLPQVVKRTAPEVVKSTTHTKDINITKDITKEKKEVLKETQKEEKFLIWWHAYPGNKTEMKKCRTKYYKVIDQHEKIMEGVKNYIGYINWLKEKQKTIPRTFVPEYKNSSTWLNNECWNDSYGYDKPKTAPKLTEQQQKQAETNDLLNKAGEAYSKFEVYFYNDKYGVDGWSFFNMRGKHIINAEDRQELAKEFKKNYPKTAEIIEKQQQKSQPVEVIGK